MKALLQIADGAKSLPRDAVIRTCIRAGIDSYNRARGSLVSGEVFGAGPSLGEKLDAALVEFWDGYSASWAARDTFPIGDAYQALDVAAVNGLAFCQTPRFVATFLCARSVDAAVNAVGTGVVRVLDPACGSGHILCVAIEHLHALGVTDLSERIVGSDVNPVASALCRWRTATLIAELGGSGMPDVCVADALDIGNAERRSPELPYEDHARFQLHAKAGFHAIVANPPYIVDKDSKHRAYDRARYVSATGKYGLGVVFSERMFALGAPGAFIAQITSNAFMKREYGKAFVEKVLPRFELTHVINTSGAYIPGHGTPTVILVARNIDAGRFSVERATNDLAYAHKHMTERDRRLEDAAREHYARVDAEMDQWEREGDAFIERQYEEECRRLMARFEEGAQRLALWRKGRQLALFPGVDIPNTP